MGCAPDGVATSVSGAAQTHSGQPGGQVSSTGSVQAGGPTGPTGTTQHSWPSVQHSEPQQLVPPGQGVVPGSQGASAQVPLSQNGKSWSHRVPQSPQLWMSLPLLTHVPSQHSRPWVQAGSQSPLLDPPVPLLVLPPEPLLALLPPEPLLDPPPEPSSVSLSQPNSTASVATHIALCRMSPPARFRARHDTPSRWARLGPRGIMRIASPPSRDTILR